MTHPNFPDTIPRQLDELHQRLRALETAPRANNTVVQNGTFMVVDGTNAERVRVGTLSDGTLGFEVHDAAGLSTLKVNDTGLTFPGINVPFRVAAQNITVTAASYVSTWECSIGYIAGDTIRWTSQVTADAATTGTARLYAPTVTGAPATATIAIAAGTQTQLQWNWQVPGMSLATGPVLIQLQILRASGAGNLNAYAPDNCWMSNHTFLGGTVTGL